MTYLPRCLITFVLLKHGWIQIKTTASTFLEGNRYIDVFLNLEYCLIHIFNFCFRNFDHAPFGRGKGCGIFSMSSRLISQQIHKVVTEKYQLMSLVDITSIPYQLVLVYASSGCPFQELTATLITLLKSDMTSIIIGDFNFDAKEVNPFSRFMKEKAYNQLVNWPTHREGRTIDHCYVSKNTRVQLTRHSPYYSDHDALCMEFEHFPWY